MQNDNYLFNPFLFTRFAGHNTDPPLNSNISKTVKVNITFTTTISR